MLLGAAAGGCAAIPAADPTLAPESVASPTAPAVPAWPSTTAAREPSRSWSFGASAYAWLPSKRGVIETGSTGIPLDDPDESTGAFLYLEGQGERWGFVADLSFLSSEDQADIATGTIDIDEDSFIGEVDATYRVQEGSTLQFLAGVRVLDSSQDIRFPILPDVSTDTTLVDPVVGAQGTWPLGERFGFRLRGDVGGFGVDSDFTYQMFGVFGWEFLEHWHLTAGYRVLGWEFEQDDVRNDLRLSGPLLGLAAAF